MSAAVLALVVALVGLRKPAQAVKLEMRGDRCRADEWNGRARFAQRKRRGFCLRTGHQSMLTQMKLSSVWLMAPRKPSWTVAAWPLPSSAATSASRSIYRGAAPVLACTQLAEQWYVPPESSSICSRRRWDCRPGA